MYHILTQLWMELLHQGFAEDGSLWDWSSLGLVTDRIKAQVVAKSDGVWAAETLVLAVEQSFPGIDARSLLNDGAKFKRGQVLVELKGDFKFLIALERPFLNLAAYVSGIATATQETVDAVRLACPEQTPRVTLTRKTLPGYRDLAIHAVRLGGGHPHRVSLSGGVLIKENHIAAAGSMERAVAGARASAPHGLKIEVEVRNRDELKQALLIGVDGVMLDNFSSDEVSSAVQWLHSRQSHLFIEVSGGLNLQNVAHYALPGVDVLSVGSLTHSVQCVDLSFLVDGT
jgi:nicotinate-nucleotide pyrophosphorylase (carboxylating)